MLLLFPCASQRCTFAGDPIATSLGLTPDQGALPIWTAPDDTAEQALGRFVRSTSQGVVLIGHPRGGTATGFVISRNHRLVATNAHVADSMHRTGGELFALPNGDVTRYRVSRIWYHPGVMRIHKGADGKLLLVNGTDPEAGEIYPSCPDVAVLQLEDEGPALPVEYVLATPQELRDAFAQSIAMLGYPGHDTNRWPDPGQRALATFHTGVISRVSDFRFGSLEPRQMLQHTAANWFGFSGSPLLLPNGHVIGLNNSIRKVEGQGFTRDIANGIRVDCLWELLAFHQLDDWVPIPVDRASLDLARFESPRPLNEAIQPKDAQFLVWQAWRTIDGGVLVEIVDEALNRPGDATPIEKCTRAIQLAPEYAEAYYWRAEAVRKSLEVRGLVGFTPELRPQCEQALEDYGKASQLKPSSQVTVLRSTIRMLHHWAMAIHGHTPEEARELFRMQVELTDRLLPVMERLAPEGERRLAEVDKAFDEVGGEPLQDLLGFGVDDFFKATGEQERRKKQARSQTPYFDMFVDRHEMLLPDVGTTWAEIAPLYRLRAEARCLTGDFRGAIQDYAELRSAERPENFQKAAREEWNRDVEKHADSLSIRGRAREMTGLIKAAREDYREAEGRYTNLAKETSENSPSLLARAEQLRQRREKLDQPRGRLGVSLVELTAERAAERGYDGHDGVIIEEVASGGPAARAGLQAGDIIARFLQFPVRGIEHVIYLVGTSRPKGSVELTIFRSGSSRTVRVELDETVAHLQEEIPEFGITVQTLSLGLAHKWGFDEQLQGAIVLEVRRGSAASAAELRPGDVIVAGMVLNPKAGKPVQESIPEAALLRRFIDYGCSNSLSKSVRVWIERSRSKSQAPAAGWVERGRNPGLADVPDWVKGAIHDRKLSTTDRGTWLLELELPIPWRGPTAPDPAGL